MFNDCYLILCFFFFFKAEDGKGVGDGGLELRGVPFRSGNKKKKKKNEKRKKRKKKNRKKKTRSRGFGLKIKNIYGRR